LAGGGLGMGSYDGTVDHHVIVVAVAREQGEYALPPRCAPSG
jgi:hypothetical protein